MNTIYISNVNYHKQSLANALTSRDIESFRRALHSPTEVEKYETNTSMTIFEKACQTPGSGQFIEECILAGCDVNKVNYFFCFYSFLPFN